MKLEEGVIYPLFSTPLYHVNAPECNIDVINFDDLPYELFSSNEKQDNTINSIEQNILGLEEFSDIKKHVDAAMCEYVFGQLKLPTNLDLKLVCSWMLIGFPGSKTNAHLHTNSMFSGIFYLKSEENAGDLIFSAEATALTYTSHVVKPIPTEFNLINSRSWTIKPKTKDIVIFPSHVLHEVTENLSGEIRCAIAFNYFMIGEISDMKTRKLYLQ